MPCYHRLPKTYQCRESLLVVWHRSSVHQKNCDIPTRENNVGNRSPTSSFNHVIPNKRLKCRHSLLQCANALNIQPSSQRLCMWPAEKANKLAIPATPVGRNEHWSSYFLTPDINTMHKCGLCCSIPKCKIIRGRLERTYTSLE